MWFSTEIILVSFQLTCSLSRISRWNTCGITGGLILFVSSRSELLVMCVLVKVPDLSQALLWFPTWAAVHLITYDCLGHSLDIQSFDDTLSWVTLSLGSTFLLGRWRRPCQVSFSWFLLRFVTLKATGSALLWSSILIWHSVSALFFALACP